MVKGFQFCTWIDSEKVKRRPPTGSARFSRRLKEEQSKRQVLVAAAHLPKSNRHRHVAVDYSHWNPGSCWNQFDPACFIFLTVGVS